MYLKEKEIFDIGHVLLLILYEVKVFIYCLFSPKFHVLFHANHFLLDLYNTMTKKKSYSDKIFILRIIIFQNPISTKMVNISIFNIVL